MIFYALIRDNGCVDQAGISRNPPDGHVPLPPGALPEAAPRLMFVDGEWQMRPWLPPVDVGPIGFALSPAPDGLVCWVQDYETGALLGQAAAADGDLAVSLPDPGEYLITFDVPEPWVALDALRITVPE